MSVAGRHIAGVFMLGSALTAAQVQAQLPLSIDELLVEQRTLKL